MSELIIRPVISKADLRTFIRVTETVYKDDPVFIQPLMLERMESLSKDKNPFFLHAEGEYWIAERSGKAVGRISAQVDPNLQEKWGPGLGHFGLFEATDFEAAEALFKTAADWLKAKGMTRIQGPWSLSANQECGMLVDGFDTPPVVMMPHGRPEYDGWLKKLGFEKAKDLLAWYLDIRDEPEERIGRIVAMGKRNKKIKIREIDMKRFDEELALILDIFNDAWADNWGFTPFTDAEATHTAASLKPIVKPYRTLIAEYDGEPVGFMVTIPDVNHHIRDLKGELFPFGIFKLLARMLGKKSDERVRVPLMGIRKSLQKSKVGGIIPIMLIEATRPGVRKRGATFAELGWILEDNDGMNNMLREVACVHYKTMRIYEKPIG